MDIKLFTPYEKQKQFLDRFADTDDLFGVVVAPRGSGKTLLGINAMLYWLLSKPNRRGGWISPVYQQAKSVLDTMVETSKGVITSSNRMEATISFINGSTLKFLSADSADNIRGFRFTHLILDEVAYTKDTVIGATILPTLNPNGKKCLMISTPRGKNHFYDWYMKKETVSMSFPLTECPYISKDLVDEARRSLPPDLFKQEFLAEFVDSGNDVFIGVDKVSNIQAYDLSRKQDALIGIDTGLTDDFSVLTIISPIGRVLFIDKLNNLPLQEIAGRFISYMKKFNVIGGNIESNGIGAAMYDLIAPHFRRVKKFTTTQDSKTELVRKLIADIESMNIELPTPELCSELHREFGTFTYKMSNNGKLSFGHSSGAKDDHIDALLLANGARNQFMDRGNISIAYGGSKSGYSRNKAFRGLPS
tara:strand:- start:1212 stop:2468 length:1257 start_codon:yes stop_codon:yes gene_type:complete